MARPTATIRVTCETRDLLAREASERGISLAAMLAQIARDLDRDAVFRSERHATRTDAGNRHAVDEMRTWEGSLGDGID